MIRGFHDPVTAKVFEGASPKGFPPDLVKVARRKLGMLNAAHQLSDLKAPPGNKLHALKEDRTGQHAIRINDQFRICFVWKDGHAFDVEITDYH